MTRYRARLRLPQPFTSTFETSYCRNVVRAFEGRGIAVLDASVVERLAPACTEASGSFHRLGGLDANLRSDVASPV